MPAQCCHISAFVCSHSPKVIKIFISQLQKPWDVPTHVLQFYCYPSYFFWGELCHKWTDWVGFFQHNQCWSVINKSEAHCHICALQTWSLQPFFYHQREWREHWSAGFQHLSWVSYTMHAHFHESIEQTDIRAEAGEGKTYFYCSNCHWIMHSWLHKDKQAYEHAYSQIYDNV